MANLVYADSGEGWLIDKRFFKDVSGLIATINGRSYHTTRNGALIFATVYLPNGYTGPVVISTNEQRAAYDQGSTRSQGSFEYAGYTWYITQFRYWMVGDYEDSSHTSQKLSLNTTDYEEVGVAILEAANIIREEDFTTSLEKIYYNGKSKVIKRICQLINQLHKLGTSHTDAYYGDLGQIAYEHSQTQGNAHNLTLEDLGLEKVNDQIASILDAIGSTYYWATDSTKEDLIVDHDDDYIVFKSPSQILAWH